MMEEGLESSASEDNSDIGLGFGDESQKVEKMNQQFSLLKKKLLRSHDLVKKYSNAMRECERLTSELEASQRETERIKQQYLTAAAKALKLSIDNPKLEESNRKLQKLVTERETTIAANLSNIQQLNSLIQQHASKCTDMEDRHSDRIMELNLEKSELELKINDLEEEIKRMNKLYGNESEKLEEKFSKKGNKCQQKSSPVKSSLKSRRIAGLGAIDDDDGPLELKHSPKTLEEVPENVLEAIPEVSKRNSAIYAAKLPKKSTKEIGVNVDQPIPLEKPVMRDKNIMTDEFYSIKDNPYPIFCGKCEQLLEEIPEDAISKAMSLPPHLPALPPSPVRPIRRQSLEGSGVNSPVVLDSLQRRVKLLEKRIKRQKKVETPQGCCSHSHSMNQCHNNSFNQPNQFDMMTEFFGRMMQLPGFRRESVRGQKKFVSAKMKRVKSRTTTERSRDSSIDNWEVQPEFITENSRNSFRNDEHHDPEGDFFNSMSSNRTGKRRRETNERIINEPGDSRSQRVTSDPGADLFEENCLSTSGKRKNGEIGDSTAEEVLSRKKKREDPPKPVSIRSNLLEKLRKLKKNNTAVKPLPTALNKKREQSESVTSTEDIPLKKRVAHIPRKSERTPAPKVSDEKLFKLPEDRIIAIVTKEKRMTRSLRKSTEDKSRKNDSLNLSKEEIINNKSTEDKNRKNESLNLSKEEMINNKFTEDKNNQNDSLSSSKEEIINNKFTEDKNKKNESLNPSKEEIINNKSTEDKNKKNESLNPSKEEMINNKFTEDKNNKNDSLNPSKEEIINNKSTENKNQGNELVNSLKEEIIDEKSIEPDSSTSETNQLPVEKSPEITEEAPQNMIIDEDTADMVIDESPASPEEPPDLSSDILKSPSTSKTTPVPASSDTEEPPSTPKISNCIRELRNRQIHVSPAAPKPIPLFQKESSPPLDLPPPSPPPSPRLEQPIGPPPPQKLEKIEDLLNNYLNTSKKRRGRKPKAFEAAKILHEKAEKLIFKELQRLVDSPDWEDSLHNEVVLSLLNTRSTRTVAKAVVDFLVDRSVDNEPLDMTYTPPAPPMTKSLQRIVTLLKDLDSKMPELINFVFRAIEFTLFRLNSNPTWNALEELSRLFTVLSRIKKDRERVRIMCCDAAYALQKKSAVVLHAVLTCWPEVLPMFDAEKSQHLPVCIVHVVGMHSTEGQNSKKKECEQVKKLMKSYFKYPQNDPSEVFGSKLLDVLGKNYDKSVETAILLLSKKEGTEWANKHLIQGLMQMIIEGKSLSIYHSLKLLGFLMRPFPVADTDESVKKIVEQLRALVHVGTGDDLQEGAISALLSLQRHRFDEIACSVLNWQPKRELPGFLMEQLNAFFGARTVQWGVIKGKSRKYVSNL